MRIYHDNQAERFTVIVSPAVKHKNVMDWRNPGGVPKTFHVVFRYGAAEVDSNLGDYMIDEGLANASPLIVPDSVRAEVRKGPKLFTAPPVSARKSA